jgi:hypothetical protein
MSKKITKILNQREESHKDGLSWILVRKSLEQSEKKSERDLEIEELNEYRKIPGEMSELEK